MTFTPDPKITLYCFDVDGTLVKPKSGETFRKTADDWEWLPGRLDTLRLLIAHGAQVALVTNQGGVAFGYFDVDDIHAELERMLVDIYGLPGAAAFYDSASEDFASGGHAGHYEHLRVCFSHPNAKLDYFRVPEEKEYFRKPAPGMLIGAMLDHHAYPRHTLMVGDREEDALAASNAGCKFSWAQHFFGENGEFIPSSTVYPGFPKQTVQGISVVDDLTTTKEAISLGQEVNDAWGPISEEQQRYAAYRLEQSLQEMAEAQAGLEGVTRMSAEQVRQVLKDQFDLDDDEPEDTDE